MPDSSDSASIRVRRSCTPTSCATDYPEHRTPSGELAVPPHHGDVATHPARRALDNSGPGGAVGGCTPSCGGRWRDDDDRAMVAVVRLRPGRPCSRIGVHTTAESRCRADDHRSADRSTRRPRATNPLQRLRPHRLHQQWPRPASDLAAGGGRPGEGGQVVARWPTTSRHTAAARPLTRTVVRALRDRRSTLAGDRSEAGRVPAMRHPNARCP